MKIKNERLSRNPGYASPLRQNMPDAAQRLRKREVCNKYARWNGGAAARRNARLSYYSVALLPSAYWVTHSRQVTGCAAEGTNTSSFEGLG